ncbi:ClpXP protease specificity-enhancing factor [Hydrogenophaga sp. RWCD_12]|uniref:ClpXP protease specificity-enhancing factor n=1 Tax=Hydrogenophaga sp. RWCD_12 TaxID=3391190 RepID=UPI003985442E
MTRDDDQEPTSTRPYLIRALHEWCTDNGFAPHIAVRVDGSVRVPIEFVRNGEIVLNVGFEATNGLRLGNDFIEFKARFGGVAREIVVPVTHVTAIYARENGQGMAFPPPDPSGDQGQETAPNETGDAPPSDEPQEKATLRPVPSDPDAPDGTEPPGTGPGRGGTRPQLKRVK